jgi:Cof subfamily protein (haloacid dehalogenase superfamily)
MGGPSDATGPARKRSACQNAEMLCWSYSGARSAPDAPGGSGPIPVRDRPAAGRTTMQRLKCQGWHQACGMPARLVALDLDGTLLEEVDRLPAEHVRAVAELRAMGVAVVLVTGRPLLTTRWVWEQLALGTPLVCFNGGWVGIPGQEPFAWQDLGESETRRAIAGMHGLGGAIAAYPDIETWLMDREIPHTRHWRELYHVRIEVDAGRFAPWSGRSWKLMYICEPRHLEATEARLRAALGASHQVVVSQEDRIEVLPGGITKAWGLERLAAHLGVARDQVWAVGDAENDREMIAWAGHGCAMGQASASLRASARHVLPSIAERGLQRLPALLEAALGR